MKKGLVDIHCDECDKIIGYGVENSGFLMGEIYCKKCAKKK